MAMNLRRLALRLLVPMLVWLVCGLTVADPRLAGSADTGRRPPTLEQAYVYTDGLEVRITNVRAGRRLGLPVVELTVELGNHSSHTFEAWLQGVLRYGADRRLAVRYLTPPGPDDLGSVQSIAVGGFSNSYRLSFVLPPDCRGDVVFELGIDAGAHEPAVFAGSLREA